jgi:hypothetical protein
VSEAADLPQAVWLVRMTGLSPDRAALLLEVDPVELEAALLSMCTCGHDRPCTCLTDGCPCVVEGCPCAHR